MTPTRKAPTRRRAPGAVKRPTIKDIALLAGVDTSAVSRILNHSRTHTYSEATRQRVFEVSRQLRYRPHRAAQLLVCDRKWIVGCSSPQSVDLARDMTEETANLFSQGPSPFVIMSMAAGSRNYEVLLVFRHATVTQGDVHFVGRSVNEILDGLLYLSPEEDDKAFLEVAESGLPLVVVGKNRFTDLVNSLDADNYQAGRTMTRILLERGHRDIAYCQSIPGALAVSRMRRSGFEDEMRSAGMEAHVRWIRNGDSMDGNPVETVHDALRGALRPTAIICEESTACPFVLRTASACNLSVPRDCSLVSLELSSLSLVEPARPLSGMSLPVFDMFHTATDWLFDMIENPDQPVRTLALPCRFVEGDTLGPPPSR